MSTRKRSSRAVEDDSGDAEPSLLHRLRNMWQFANLCQWIYIFGKAAKIDESIEVEELEAECLKPSSTVLNDIALALLKLVSSHRGLTHDIFDEQARKQYLSKAPDRNPFGDSDVALKFEDFDVFTKIQILQQLTQWIMIHPDRIRDKMDEQRDAEQTSWRIEPYGWDAEDHTYFVLDDNRVYRLTEPPPSQPTPKPKKSKTSRARRRSSKRRRTTLSTEDDQITDDGDNNKEGAMEDDGLGGMVWECLAVTLDEVRSLVDGFRKTRDENEKILRKQLEDHLVPILEKQEESRKRKEMQRERELLNLAKMANAKRSSRLAQKAEQQKQEEREKEEEQQRREAEAASRREEAARLKAEKERDNRIYSREKRLREREARRLQHEEELAQLSEDSRKATNGNGRASERRLQAEIERNRQAIKELEEEEEDWVFDCVCGLYGQIDDGSHSVACERCNVWQHSKCLGISEKEAERPDFQFICSSCRRREEEAKARPRPTIKLKVNRPTSSGTQSRQEPATKISAGIPEALPITNVFLSGSTTQGQPTNRLGQDSADAPLVASNTTHLQAHRSDLYPQHKSSEPMAGLGHSSLTHKVDLNSHHAPQDDAKVQCSKGSNSHPPTIIATPLSAASPTNSVHGIQAGRSFGSVLRTPEISRDIYRAAHVENGTLPAQAGFSPIKHSPPQPRPAGQTSASKTSTTTPILPPVASLSPSPRQQVLTPPSKQTDPLRPYSAR